MKFIVSGIVLWFAGYLAAIDSSTWPWFFGFGLFMFFSAVGSERTGSNKSILARWNGGREHWERNR